MKKETKKQAEPVPIEELKSIGSNKQKAPAKTEKERRAQLLKNSSKL